MGLLWLLLSPLLLEGQSGQELTRVGQVRTLSAAEAARERPIHLHGVVSGVSAWKNSFFLQDATAGISVDRLSALPELEPGDRVEVVGVTHAGKFAPIIQARAVTVHGRANLPRPRRVQLDELTRGTLDSQWATVTGVVRTASIKPIWGRDTLVLELDLGGDILVTARVRSYEGDAWRRLPASRITLKGVCASVFNDRRQFIAARFFVSSMKDIAVLEEGPSDLFDRPVRAMSSLTRFDASGNAYSPVKVRGVVTSVQAGGRIYLQSGPEAALIKLPSDAKVARGSSLEVVGYPAKGDYAPLLYAAAFRPSEAVTATPTTVSASGVIVDKDGFFSSPYDAMLIRVTGKVLESIPGDEDSIIFLEDHQTIFTARLPGTAGKAGLPLAGSVLQITGICNTRVDDAHEPRGFRVLLDRPSDIVLLQRGPWWTAERATRVVAVLLATLLFVTGFAIFSRREAALRQLSLSDALTGILNRRGFLMLAEQQWRLAQRNHATMLIFYIDLDRFKEINDVFGHKQGDAALKRTAEILQSCFRTSDVIGRIGGDEFAVVACEAMPQSQGMLERRLQSLLDASNQRQEERFQLSLSVGTLVCDRTLDSLSMDDLLAKADEMMYAQKAARRSRAAVKTLVGA